MAREIKHKKSTFFVVCGINEGQLVSKTIEASNFNEAHLSFFTDVKIKPSIITGPFFKKRGYDQEHFIKLKFAGPSKRAIYDGWNVTAQFLLEPANSAYLLFNSRIDGKKIPRPDSHIIVDIHNLRFYEK